MNGGNDGIYHLQVRIGVVGRRNKRWNRELLKYARGSPEKSRAAPIADCDSARIGSINGLRVEDGMKHDGKKQNEVSGPGH